MRTVLAVAAILAGPSSASAGPGPQPEGWGFATAEDCAPADVAPALHVATITSLDWASEREVDRIRSIDIAGTRRGAARATWILTDAAIRVMLPVALDAHGEHRTAARVRRLAPIEGPRSALRAAHELEAIDLAAFDVANLGRAVEGIADDPIADCQEMGEEDSLIGAVAGEAVLAGASHRRVLAIEVAAIQRAAVAARGR